MQSLKLIVNSPLVTNYPYVFSFNSFKFPYTQSFRWKRKPIWLPTAKSKVYRVPPRPVIDEDEHKEIQRLYNNYRTYYRSIRRYFIDTVQASEQKFDKSTLRKAAKKDFEECYKINEIWNQEIEKLRNERLKLEYNNRIERISAAIEQKKIKDQQRQMEIEEEVKEISKLAPTFITRDNIDEVLEKVMNETVDYNMAIDSNGNWLKEDSKTEKEIVIK